MTGGSDQHPDRAPTRPPGPADRPWTHPSEVGLALRGDSDRRRSSIIATGVVVGGLGLLLSGMLLGTSQRLDQLSDRIDAMGRIRDSLTTLVVVRDGTSSLEPAVVIDDHGHLVVSARAMEGADELWIRGEDGTTVAAEPVATEPQVDLGVVRVDEPPGAPVVPAGSGATEGSAVLIASVTERGPVTETASVGSDLLVTDAPFAPPRPRTGVVAISESTDPDGALGVGHPVFNDDGELLGVTTRVGHDGTGRTVTLRSASEVLATARGLVDDRD